MAARTLLAALLGSAAQAGYVPTFSDKFSDLSNWQLVVEGGSDTGNNELEVYTNRSVNVHVGPQGLTLHAQFESFDGYGITSGKVTSQKAFGPYGFFNVHAIVPKGNGLWPAIWLLPTSYPSPYGTWAACGEIDIMETVCTQPQGYSTLHFGGAWPANVQYPEAPNNAYPVNPAWSTPQAYGVEWQPDFIKFWLNAEVVDGVVQGTVINTIPSSEWYAQNSSGQRYPGNAPFNQPFNIILNVAVGGDWPCSIQGCCDNMALPADMVVSLVEVWEMA